MNILEAAYLFVLLLFSEVTFSGEKIIRSLYTFILFSVANSLTDGNLKGQTIKFVNTFYVKNWQNLERKQINKVIYTFLISSKLDWWILFLKPFNIKKKQVKTNLFFINNKILTEFCSDWFFLDYKNIYTIHFSGSLTVRKINFLILSPNLITILPYNNIAHYSHKNYALLIGYLFSFSFRDRINKMFTLI